MGRLPNCTADVAKRIATSTRHTVASLILLNDKFAFLALSIMEVVLKELHFIFVALPLMFN